MSMFYTLHELSDAASDAAQMDMLMQQMAKAQQDLDSANDMEIMAGMNPNMKGFAAGLKNGAIAKIQMIQAQMDALRQAGIREKQAQSDSATKQMAVKLGIGVGAVLGLLYIYKKFR
jgi:hypothetical protein